MARRYCFLALLLCFIHFASAQDVRVYTLNKDSIPVTVLDLRYRQILADPSGKLTLRSVENSHFQSVQSNKVQFDEATVYWLRYDFRNTLPRPVRLTLAAIAYSDFYIRDSTGRWLHKTNGEEVPWSMRSDQKDLMTVNFMVPAGKTLRIYNRVAFFSRLDFPRIEIRFRLGNDPPHLLRDYNDEQNIQNTNYSALCGLLLLASIIALLFYTISKERLFLWFSLFGLSYSLPVLVTAFGNTYFREHPFINQDIMWVSLLLSGVSLAQFLALFYHIPQHYRRWHRLNVVLSALMALSWIVRVTWPGHINILIAVSQCTSLSFLFSNIFSLIWGIFRKGPGRKERMITAMPFILVASEYILLLILETVFIIDAALTHQLEDWSGWIATACFYWLIISFMWRLIKRFQQLQKQVLQETLERERIAREHEQERAILMAAQQVMLEGQVEERTAELQQSLSHLKEAQNQLIQSEKMASLGELTAGIAHEIQNPLNFVNNFSEVSVELLAELKEEAQAGRTADVLGLADDLSQNLEKIHHHGKRADHIVKGMLEHSRTGGGTKEPTNLNKLAGEYLQLAYRALRAKDKDLNIVMETSFDESLSEIAVIPQEIGRVLLNLFNNAFYAVRQREKAGEAGYQPTVEVTTRLHDGQAQLIIKDNGDGISETVLNKIMQPFFTTKPTGQGTGLGLSISYDIIVKGHGGNIDVKSTVGEGSIFTILLP